MLTALDLSIVIVNYDVRELLRQCLSSLCACQDELRFEIIVVDNSSGDGSGEMVHDCFPEVSLIASPINGGYAYANNLALRSVMQRDSASRPRYVMLLNPDTIVPPGALKAMVGFLDAHPEAGVAGPRLMRQDGTLDLACRRSFPTPAVSFYRMLGLSKRFPGNPRFARYNLTYLSPEEAYEVDAVVGACMLVRTKVLDQVGLLDESFFMYGEDLDWAFRIKANGWKVMYNGSVQVLHLKGESSKQHSAESVREFYKAMLVFHRKHYSDNTPAPLNWLVIGAIHLRGRLALFQNRLKMGGRAGNMC